MAAPEVTLTPRAVLTPRGTGLSSDRINRLSERLCGLQQGLEHERHARFQNLNQKMSDVDGTMQQAQESLLRECHVMKEALSRFHQDFEEECCKREALMEAKTKELSVVDLRLQQILEAEQQASRDAEQQILRAFDEKTDLLQEEIVREGRTREEAHAALCRYVDGDIPQLYENLREEARSRETMEERIVRRACDEIARLQDAVLAEKRTREETEEELLRMIEETTCKMRAEIAQERAERESTEEKLLDMLDETCNKLNTASQIM